MTTDNHGTADEARPGTDSPDFPSPLLGHRTRRRTFLGGSLATAATVMSGALPASGATAALNATPSGDMASGTGGCPVMHTTTGNRTNQDWWPNQLSLWVLHQHSELSNPMARSFDYAAEFATVDLSVLKREIFDLMTTSQPWWPADYGHYGPLFIRMAWHSAGTYRSADGRGGGGRGMQRFAPLNSWPDNANLDRARRLLWPIKQKYGRKLSWADLMIFAGNCAIESMGLEPVGFGGGRADVWEADEEIYWGPESMWLGDERYSGDRQLESPLAAVQMGLIYVNPEGPNGNPDPLLAAHDIRDTFGRMGMNDEETVALIAGGHTFGKCHGAVAATYLGPEPEGAPYEQQNLGWHNSYETGNAQYTMTSGLEGTWTYDPISWDDTFFEILFEHEWMLTTSPAGAKQWIPTEQTTAEDETAPDAHIPGLRHQPIMLTTDLSLRFDPDYEPISRRFLEDPDALGQAFAEAWYKLTHRDMGPIARYVGSLVPAEPRIWQDPTPEPDSKQLGQADVAKLKKAILASGLSVSELVSTAWASAATFRDTDMRGGANGARIRLAPQKDWDVNQPTQLARVLSTLETIQADFNRPGRSGGTGRAGGVKQVSLADLIVLGGTVGVEQAAAEAGHQISVPFTPGRTDATDAQTDVDSFAVLEPIHDGFRNYIKAGLDGPSEHLLVERANLLSLTAPEMTVLVGGMRVLDTNADGSAHGVLTDRKGSLTNDFFVNLLDMGNVWSVSAADGIYEAHDRTTGTLKWTATTVDVIFGANSQLRSLCEVYGSTDASEQFVADFVEAWVKVMNLDRFDLD